MRASHRSPAIVGTCGLLLLSLLGGASTRAEPKGRAAPRADKLITYERDIRPLLAERCYACHGNGSRLGGLQIDTRAGLLKGGQSGPAVMPGHSERSLLIRLVSGGDAARVMPARGKRLTAAEVALVRAWIDQGVSFGTTAGPADWTPQLALRRPKLPAAQPGITSPIDRIIWAQFAAQKFGPPAVVSDRVYARRVYLDLIGLLPTPAELQPFLADRRPDRRERLVRKLLGDNRNYAEHWISFWNDMLRNDYAGTGYIDGGRTQITPWLYIALATNMPYDRFVAQLVNPKPESAGFVKGIVWRGVVNASQTPQMQAAQNISQVFMGVNLKCASCHNSFISTWKLADSYGMAGIFADHALEMVRCDRPTGAVAPVKFLYPELGQIDPAAPREKRMEQLAAILTSRANGRLARTLVNRLWGRLMGRGLVEPADEMDDQPWNPDLLDWLAADFVDGGYDMRRLLLQIATSRAYQLPAAGLPTERAAEFHFRGPVVKRMSAEQFSDAVSSLTGVWPKPASQFQIANGQPVLPWDGRAQVRYKSGLLKAGSVSIDIDVTGAAALSLVVGDGGNGASYDWADWVEPRLVGPKGEIPLTDLQWRSASTGYGQIRIGKSVVDKPLRLGNDTYARGIGTHANSVITYLLPKGVTRFRALAGPDTGAVEQPKSETSIEIFAITADRSLLETRASMALADPLTRALGRPSREQVVTERSTVATTLQALELTNGRTLAAMLAEGAAAWTRKRGGTEASDGAAGPRTSAGNTVDNLYETALGRLPTASERTIALEMVGAPVRTEGVEDLLWSLVMLPEFELIY